MTRAKTLLAAVLTVLLVSAGCLGASGGTQTTDSIPTDASAGTTPATTGVTPTETATPAVDCPDDRYREVAVEYVAEESGTDTANVSVVNDAFVEYPILGTCYYDAKVRNAESGRVIGVFVAENGTVVDREAVEARADRAYERRYGNVSDDLYRRMESADADERIPVVVSIDVDSGAVKRAVDRGNSTDKEYKQALSDEYERRANDRTRTIVGELREIEGVTVESAGSLRVEVRATPDAIEEVQRFDRVWLDLRRETTTHLPGTTRTDETSQSHAGIRWF